MYAQVCIQYSVSTTGRVLKSQFRQEKAIHKERGKPKVLQTHQPAATIYFETGKLGGSSMAVATTERNNCSLSFARKPDDILS